LVSDGLGREQQSVFPLDQPSVKAQQRRWPYSNRNLREAVRSDQTGTDAEEQPPGRATRTNVVTRWAMRAKSSMIAVNMTAYPSVRKHALDAPEPIELEFARDTTKPEYPAETMAFMFETRAVICPTAVALALPQLQSDYSLCCESCTRISRRSGTVTSRLRHALLKRECGASRYPNSKIIWSRRSVVRRQYILQVDAGSGRRSIEPCL